MTYREAQDLAERLNADAKLRAEITRILPREIDPPSHNDDGWDLEVTVIHTPDFSVRELWRV
jgi:hypothetical protein